MRTPTTSRRTKTRIPEFKTVQEEAEFWDTRSLEEFQAEFQPVDDDIVFVPSGPKKGMTIRLDARTLQRLTEMARETGVGPSTLARMWIIEHVRTRAEAGKRKRTKGAA